MEEEKIKLIAFIIATIISLIIGFILRKEHLEMKKKDSMASVPYMAVSILVFLLVFHIVKSWKLKYNEIKTERKISCKKMQKQ